MKKEPMPTLSDDAIKLLDATMAGRNERLFASLQNTLYHFNLDPISDLDVVVQDWTWNGDEYVFELIVKIILEGYLHATEPISVPFNNLPDNYRRSLVDFLNDYASDIDDL